MILPKLIDTSITGRIEDIEKAFNAGAYLSAISLALTIPDVCGSRLYPTAKTRERYVNWFNTYVALYYLDETSILIDGELLDPRYYFDGEDCYQLRCVYLHQGINIPNQEKRKTVYNIIQFRVFDDDHSDCDHTGSISGDLRNGVFRQIDIDLGKFLRCLKLGVERFVRAYPEMNEDSSSSNFYYEPVQDFKNGIRLS